jgi:hypothetical protein
MSLEDHVRVAVDVNAHTAILIAAAAVKWLFDSSDAG